MNKIAYKEPEFKVVLSNTEDVITTSYEAEAFASVNNFITPANFNAPAQETGTWNMPGIEI